MLLLLAIFSSCSKEELVGKLSLEEKEIAIARDGKYDLLGFGYDVTGEYANGATSKNQVLDIAKFDQAEPGRFLPNESNQQQWLSNFGEDAVSYLSNQTDTVSSSLGLEGLFSTSLKVMTSDTNAFNAKYVYGSTDLTILKKSLSINATSAMLSNYVTPVFLADVSALTPAVLVSKYGTHVMTSIKLGGILEILYRAETTNSNRALASEVGVKFSAFVVFNAGGGGSSYEAEAKKNYNQKLFYRTRGGLSEYGLVGTINLDGTPIPSLSITSWQNSVKVENSDLIGFGDDGLIPIYELVTDAAKKAALKSYIDQYIKQRQTKLRHEAVPVYIYYHSGAKDHALQASTGTWPFESHGYAKLGIAFYAFDTQVEGTYPVHGYFNGQVNNHIFSIYNNDYDYSGNGYEDHGIYFYAYKSQLNGSTPISVFYSDAWVDNSYSIDRNKIPYPSTGYRYIGTNFYVFPTPVIM